MFCACLLLAGCHVVFGVDPSVQGADGGAGSDGMNACPPPPTLPPADDEDLDQISNDLDNCPTVANVDQHDENANGIGDPCDLCPAAAESQDADCDGIGDVCDPDNTRPDQRVFYGLDSLDGLTQYTEAGAEIVTGSDNVRLRAAQAAGYALINASAGSMLDGRYETRFAIHDAYDPQFITSLDVRSALGITEYSVELVGNDRLKLLLETDGQPDIVLDTQQLGATPEGTYTLIMDIVYPAVTVRLVGPVGGELSAMLTVPLDSQLRIGVSSYEAEIGVEYMAYTGAAAP